MLFLQFEMGRQRYAIDVRQIAAVLPLLAVRALPQAPPEVPGLVNYHGAPVPVVDLSQLALGRPAARRLSTRIVMVHYPDERGGTHLLGLIAERATRTVRHEPGDFAPAGVTVDGAEYLGQVATDAGGLLQWIDVRALLPAAVRDMLFQEPVDDSWGSMPSKTS